MTDFWVTYKYELTLFIGLVVLLVMIFYVLQKNKIPVVQIPLLSLAIPFYSVAVYWIVGLELGILFLPLICTVAYITISKMKF